MNDSVKYLLNMSVQFVPLISPDNGYPLVDKAIALIKQSGLKMMVTPFNTVVEGNMEELLMLQKKLWEFAGSELPAGQEWLMNIQIHGAASESLFIEEKMRQYTG